MASPNDSFDTTFTLHYITGIDTLNDTSGGIVSDRIWGIFMVTNFVVLCGIVTVAGSIANIINIIVFFKLGFKDPVNITLLALSFSDFGCCFFLIWLTICYNPLFQQLDLPFDPTDFHYLTSGWMHNIFSRITSCITAFITFERCLCVAAPLKVKAIITPKRVTIFLTFVVVLVITCIAPMFYTARYRWKFHPDKNRTILSLVFIENSQEIENIAYPIHSIFLPIATFIVVLVCTVVLVYNLRQKSKWREGATSTSSTLSSRDARVSKMVVMVAILFIVCFIPVFISVTAIVSFPEFSITGRYKNVFLIMFSYHFTLEALNSSLNIFIYYRMSSNYRSVFDQIFRRNKQTDVSKDAA